LYVLRRLIPLVFTWEELAASRGQGLNCKSTEDVMNKDPLDPTKVLVCKGENLDSLSLDEYCCETEFCYKMKNRLKQAHVTFFLHFIGKLSDYWMNNLY